MIKKGDLILGAVLVLVIAASFIGVHIYKSNDTGKHRIAVIKQNNAVVKKINLDQIVEPQRVEIGGNYKEVILVEKGRIRFEEANCPDLVCVKAGWLTKKGDMAVCLPNKVSIKIEGSEDSIDGVTF